MPRDQAHWEPSETALLLKLALEEKQKFNWNQYGVTREGWRNIYPHFPQYSHKQVTNKLDALKRKFRDWQDTQSASGLGRDTTTGGIAAEPEYWETQFGSNHPDDSTQPVETSNVAADHAHPPAFLNELYALFGDRVTNSGTYISGGGIGSSTPPHSGSKRSRGDQEEQSPHKKVREVGEMLEKISDSIATRSSSRDRARNREQEEVDAAMKLLEDDGVPKPSALYFTALKSFESSVLRREFLNMDGPEVRIPWLMWLMEQNHK